METEIKKYSTIYQVIYFIVPKNKQKSSFLLESYDI